MPMVATKAPYTLFIVEDDMPENPRDECDNFGHMICFHSRYRLGDEHNYDDTHELLGDIIRQSISDKDIIAFVKNGNAEATKLEYNRSSREWELNVYSDFFKKWFTEYSAPGQLESIPDMADTILEYMNWQEMIPLAEKANCILPVYLYDHSGLTMNTTGFHCPWDSGQVGWIYASHEQVKAEYGAVTPENLKKAESILESEVKLYDYYLTNQCYGFQLFEGDVETDSCWGFYGEIRDVQDAVKEYLPDECQDIVEVLQYRNVKMKSKNPDQDKKAKKKVLLVLLLLLIFCMSGIGIYVVYTSNSKENIPTDASSTGESKKLDDNGNAVDGAVQSKTSEQVLDELKKAQINVTDKLSSHILFPSGKAGTEGSWMVENVETNNVIMQCEVFLNDKLIAKSVPIKPNQHIETITLSKEVKAGMYDVTAYINYFKLDTKEYISKAGFRVKLTVQ